MGAPCLLKPTIAVVGDGMKTSVGRLLPNAFGMHGRVQSKQANHEQVATH